MADNQSAPLDSIESILAAIQALPEQKRLMLFDRMEYTHDWLLGYVMVPVKLLDLQEKARHRAVQVNRETKDMLVKKATEAYRRGKCSRTRAEKTARRNRLIDQAIGAGINGENAQAIFDFVAKEDQTLLFVNKRSKKCIDPKNMMKVYWDSERAKNNCNHSG